MRDEEKRRENTREQTRGDRAVQREDQREGRVREDRWAWPKVCNEVKRGGSGTGALREFICIAVLPRHSDAVGINSPSPCRT